MKKKILTLAAFFLGVMYADADNISVADVTIEPGQTASVGISLNNTETNLVSFQMDLTLPEGITVNKAGCSLSSRFTDEDQELTIGKQDGNVYRLTSTSFTLTPISGTSGEIVTLSLSAASDSDGGTATISNIRFVTSNSEKLTLPDVSFNISTINPIIFADANVKAICVANWDTNGDGELSEAEAAAVADLGEVFKDNTIITSFDELQHFTGINAICDKAFKGCTALKSIILPENLTEIGFRAFLNSGLESITFPSTLTAVGYEAFMDCNGLASIDFNRCAAYFEYNSFKGCSSLEELYIPNTVKFRNSDWSWSWNNFGNCTSLRSVVFEAFAEGQQRWSTTSVFANCTALESVVLPSASVMQKGFFTNCPNLQSVTLLEVANNFNPRQHNFNKWYEGLDPNQIQFTVPAGTAETLLKAGYMHLSDKSGLPLVRSEFEAEATRIAAMADALLDGNKTALTTAINDARTAVNAAEDYATVYEQIAAIKSAAQTFLTTATLPKNFDVTAAFVTNPDFDNLQLGWGGQNAWPSWPENKFQRGWNEAEYENGEVVISKFIDAVEIDRDRALSNGTITQTIKNVPAGIYRLECDAIATWQDDASVEVMGVNLFAETAKIAVATANEKPQHFSVKFENSVAKDITIGIRINGTNANWVAMDNVRIIYEGATAALPQGSDLVSDENARVYLCNVETGKYLSGGHAGGTHALLDETGLPVRLTQNEETGLWQIYFWEGSHDQQLLFSDNGNVYVDYNGDSGEPWWNFTQATDGSYLIQNSAMGENNYLGNDPTQQDLQAGGYSGVSYTDVNANVSVGKNTHWIIFTKNDCDLLAAKHRLMATISRMEQSEQPNEDLLSTAQTIYDNDNATLEEIIGITTALNSQMGMPKENQPVNMTAIITNPRFEDNTTVGWSGAIVIGEGGRADATSNQEHEFFQTNFNMYQTITGVPNGRYLLKWKGLHRPGSFIESYNAYSEGIDNASAIVYANEVEKTMKNLVADGSTQSLNVGEDVSEGNYFPYSMEAARKYFDSGFYADQLEVVVTDNVLTIGVKCSEMTTLHWVVFTDFELEIIENAEQLNNKLVASIGKGLKGGKAQIPILMENESTIAGVQFKIRTPEGISVSTDDSGDPKVTGTSRINGMTIMSAQQSDYTQVLIYGIGKYVNANNGAIANVVLDIANTLELGNYSVDIYDIVMSDANGLRIAPFSVKSTVTLVEAELGDANHDGEVDVADIIAVANYILGRPSAQFDETTANVNGDSSIDVADIIGMVNSILYSNQSQACPTQNVDDTLDPQ